MNAIVVTVVLAFADRAIEHEVRLQVGSTVADALERFPAQQLRDVDLARAPVGVWGRRVSRDRVLVDGDRVEIYRPLLSDPKDTRRRRARTESSR